MKLFDLLSEVALNIDDSIDILPKLNQQLHRFHLFSQNGQKNMFGSRSANQNQVLIIRYWEPFDHFNMVAQLKYSMKQEVMPDPTRKRSLEATFLPHLDLEPDKDIPVIVSALNIFFSRLVLQVPTTIQ